MRRHHWLLGLGLVLAGCDVPQQDLGGEGDPGGKADGIAAACGAHITNFGGKGARTNNDPVANTMACATTFKAAVATLHAHEPKGCDVFNAALVSERSQLLQTDAGFRMVMNHGCGTRAAEKLWFAPRGESFTTGGRNLSDDVEIMAFDENKQAFNYYALEGGRWFYHGDSFDMIAGPSDQPGQRRCAACHTGGGPIMKERRVPWMNWKNGFSDNGGTLTTAIIADAAGKLGQPLNELEAYDLQPLIDRAIILWNTSRVSHLMARLSHDDPAATRALLKPIFCTVEMNLLSSLDGEQMPAHRERGGLLADVVSNPFDPEDSSFIEILPAAYTAATAAANQRVVGASVNGKIVRETALSFAFAERSGADISYADDLSQLGGTSNTAAASDLLISAAKHTDPTRPVFSGGMPGLAPGRCELLNLAPAVDADPQHPDKVFTAIHDGFVAALQAKKSVGLTAIEQQFLTNLTSGSTLLGDATWQFEFFRACDARNQANPAAFARDIMRVVSANRRLATQLPIVEDKAFLFPTDDLPVDLDVRLDPVTCVLR